MGGAAINTVSSEISTSRRPVVDGLEADFENARPGSALAVILVACAAISLALFPITIALSAPNAPDGLVAGVLGTMAAVIATLKVVAMAWGVASRLLGVHRASVAAAYAD